MTADFRLIQEKTVRRLPPSLGTTGPDRPSIATAITPGSSSLSDLTPGLGLR